MVIVVPIFISIVAIELAIIIWLLLCILHELKKCCDHKKPHPHPQPCL